MGRSYRKRKSTKKQSHAASFMIVVAIVCVCVVMAVRVKSLHSKSAELEETKASIEKQIEAANLEAENLKAQEQYMHTNEYIEDVAKSKLGLVYPDEIVIRPKE